MLNYQRVWDVEVSYHRGTPNSWMVYFMENPMDDLGVPPISENLHILGIKVHQRIHSTFRRYFHPALWYGGFLRPFIASFWYGDTCFGRQQVGSSELPACWVSIAHPGSKEKKALEERHFHRAGGDFAHVSDLFRGVLKAERHWKAEKGLDLSETGWGKCLTEFSWTLGSGWILWFISYETSGKNSRRRTFTSHRPPSCASHLQMGRY